MPKTIFGTTEKSNFILNMRPETVQKWIHGVLLCCVIVPQLGAMAITLSNTTTVWLSSFLYATGFTGILFYLIVMLRADLKFFENPAYTIISVIALLSVVSYYGILIRGGGDEYLKTALFGTQGRYEGLLSLLAYFGIFLVATCVSRKKTIKSVFDILICAGILQAVYAVLQHIPGLGFPSDFNDLPFTRLQNVMLSSGLADSPIFYGSFVTLVSGVAVMGAIFDKSIIRARVYGLAAVLFLLTGLFTSSIVPIIGIGAALAGTVVIVALNRAKGVELSFKGGLLITPELRFAVLFGTLLGVFTLVYLFQGIYIRDKAIALSDAFFRLWIIGNPSPVNPLSLYQIAWTLSMDMALALPLTGVGPDCFAFVQFHAIDSIDKSYNEYLFIAATRGIPSLLAYLALIWVALRKGIGRMGDFFRDSENWFAPALFIAVAAYLLQSFWSVSAITVAPFFWLLLGFMCAKRIED
ncbi:MAG: hypothetical protein FWG90_09920 [Oscillospiraceae bacterium]|nr:hypothetical protein [Oscillospiraceae bacterium]